MDCSMPGLPVRHYIPEFIKLMSTESMMPSNHLILCHSLFPLPSIFPTIKVFFSESVLCIRWPKFWNFSFSIYPSNEYSGWFPFRSTGLISLKSQESSLAPQFESIISSGFNFMVQLSHLPVTTGKTIALTICTFVSSDISAF